MFILLLLIISIGKQGEKFKRREIKSKNMSDVLVIEHGLSMRKLYRLLFKDSNIFFAKTADEIIKIYRIKRPKIVVILSQNPQDADLANLVKMLNPRAKIIWVSPDETIKNIVSNEVDLFVTPPFQLDDFIIKFEELRRANDYSSPLVSA